MECLTIIIESKRAHMVVAKESNGTLKISEVAKRAVFRV